MSRVNLLDVSCDQLSFQRGERPVLNQVSCAFPAGALTAVVGPNGAGKSTLLQLLAGVLSPLGGEISLGSHSASLVSRSERAQLSAFLPQAEAPAWSLCAEDMVALGLLPWGRVADRHQRVRDALELVDAAALAQRPVTQLSGGELRRVQLARLLVGDPPLLIADEPTNALDIRHQLQLMQSLRSLAERGHTVVVALHDLGLAARFCNRIVLMNHGEVVAEGDPHAVFTEERIGAVYGVRSEMRWRDGRAEFVPLDLL